MMWEPILGLVLGLVALERGIAFRRGSWRGFESVYRNDQLPAKVRNLPFALIPLGLMFILAVVAGLSVMLLDVRVLSLILFATVPLILLVAVWWAIRLPAIAKPRWTVDAHDVAGSQPLPRKHSTHSSA